MPCPWRPSFAPSRSAGPSRPAIRNASSFCWLPSGFGLPLLYCQLLRRRGAVIVPAGQLDRKRLGFLKLLAHRTRVVPLLLASAEGLAPLDPAPDPWPPPKSGAAPIWSSNSTTPSHARPPVPALSPQNNN
jgi:hypothetical protein